MAIVRAPVAGLSMASTTSSSLQNSNSRIGFCRFPTNRTSSFLGSGGNIVILKLLQSC
ncbi:hypothetical protein Hanom_Chr12g01176801 [Helianthus anomalus]